MYGLLEGVRPNYEYNHSQIFHKLLGSTIHIREKNRFNFSMMDFILKVMINKKSCFFANILSECVNWRHENILYKSDVVKDHSRSENIVSKCVV